MSSPNLNNLIIVGCLLSYSGVIILGLDSSLTSEPAFRYICTVKAWVLMAGFTLSFGSMFSKTWRVHSIFTNVQLNKKVRKKINGIVLLFSPALLSSPLLLKNVSTGQNFRVSVLCGNFPVFRFVWRTCSCNNNFSQSYLCWKTFKTNLGKSESFVIIEKIFCLIDI